jgi:hypothetical protein
MMLAQRLRGALDGLRRRPRDPFAGKLASLAEGPKRLRAVVTAVPAQQRSRRPAAGGFSIIEHACHLRDIEADGYAVRLARIAAEEKPHLPDLDGEALARERDYQAQDALAACDAFTATRAQVIAGLAALSPAQRERLGLLDGKTPFTLDEMVVAMLAHDAAHLKQLAELRAELLGLSG